MSTSKGSLSWTKGLVGGLISHLKKNGVKKGSAADVEWTEQEKDAELDSSLMTGGIEDGIFSLRC
jgi:hypothetical protein